MLKVVHLTFCEFWFSFIPPLSLSQIPSVLMWWLKQHLLLTLVNKYPCGMRVGWQVLTNEYINISMQISIADQTRDKGTGNHLH